MKCIIEAELTPNRFAELGQPCHIFREPARKLVALASQMPHLGYPGHSLFTETSPPQHRLSIYSESDGTLLGVIATKFPINDVVFDPDAENVLIATGSYDGGFFFSGYLLRYNWRTRNTEQMLGQSRDIVACRYDDGGTITVLMRPNNEEEFLDDGRDDWSIVLGLKIDSGPGPWSREPAEVPREDPRLDGLPPSVPSDHGFSDDVLIQDRDKHLIWRQEAVEWLQGVRAEYYCGIWDLQWIDSSIFAVTANKLAIELRDIHGDVRKRIECEGSGVELINHPHLGLLSHVQQHGQYGGSIDTKSELWQWSEGQPPTKHSFERPYAFSFDLLGHGLAIDLSWGNQRDRRNLILGPSGRTVASVDCGITDRLGPVALPHGLDSLYFLKRESDETFGNNDYQLWRHQGEGRFVCARQWDSPDRDFCPVTSIAYSKDVFLGAGPVWNRSVHQNLGRFLELVELKTGRRLLSIQLQGSPTRVAVSEDKQTGIVGYADGRLAIYDLKTRRAIGDFLLSKNGMPSVPLALAINGNNLLIGTHDGRVLAARLVS
jgi:WD40 repeat protein